MEAIDTIITMISTVGFPIVACIYMFKLFNELQKTLADLNVSLSIMNERISEIENKLDDKTKEE